MNKNQFKIKMIIAILIGFMLLSINSYGETKQLMLMGARLSHNKHVTRIVFEFNQMFSYHLFALDNPTRVVVDLPQATLETNLAELPLTKSFIKDIRHGQFNKTTLRLVFDLKKKIQVKNFILKPEQQYGYRLVLDFSPTHHTVSSVKTVIHPSKQLINEPITSSKPTLTLASKQFGKGRDIIVVIDPGHGGKDPGATGPHGIHEKNVVLAISKDLQKDINHISGMKADLTRRGDYYLTLRDRLRVARQDHGDFFIAIHADAYRDRNAQGASVFALSERGATSEAARWLAEKENYSELGGVYLANKSRLLRSVLIDLSQTATITESLQVGNIVLQALRHVTVLHANRVEQARFVVLKSPDIPSLLVETGFITNAHEEKRLNSPAYQKKLAAALAQGIYTYFKQNPPPNTLFAEEKHIHE